jgi:hypothetical protein
MLHCYVLGDCLGSLSSEVAFSFVECMDLHGMITGRAAKFYGTFGALDCVHGGEYRRVSVPAMLKVTRSGYRRFL